MELSVVSAVYNGEEYLVESIDSILKQTFPHFEFIIVNDGSSDRTKEILDSVTDPRVKVIHLEKNGGAAHALNVGISEAKSKWIALQDADDVSVEQRLERQLQHIKSESNLIAVGSFIQCIPGNDLVDHSSLEWEALFFNSKENFRNEQFYSTPLCHGTAVFSKNAYERTGGYDPTFHIAYDYDLWTRMFEEGEISVVPEVLYKYRIRGNSLAHVNKIDTTIEVLLSTFKNISLLRYKHLNRKPRLLLVGSKKESEFYMDNLESKNHYVKISILDYSDSGGTKQAYSLYQSNKIDGIILTDKKRRFLSFFNKRGLSFGKNLFNIWMP